MDDGQKRDIVIVGGGMVGATLALQLAASLPESIAITVVEQVDLSSLSDGDYHPSFDARTTALSASTRWVFEQLGLWQALGERLCPVDSVHVSQKGHFGSTLLSKDDMGWQMLGGVVENAWLGRVLLKRLQASQRIELISPATVEAATAQGELHLVGCQTQRLQADLLLIADGAESRLRDSLGIRPRHKHHPHHALIANVSLAKPHHNRAFERFTERGPLALLPLLNDKQLNHRAALIWSLPAADAQALQALPEADFIDALQADFGYRLGRIKCVGQRQCYPLQLLELTTPVQRGVLVMGNAAHALHPVAGQGFNLAVRDVVALSEVLCDALAADTALGDQQVLERYQAAQQGDQARTMLFSDHLPGVFTQDFIPLQLARGVGLTALDITGAARHAFTRFAAGITALNKGVSSGL